MSKTKSIVFQLKFVDLLNNPFPNLYHEVRESGMPISVSKSDSRGLGTPISRPPSTILVVHIRHPLTKEMIKVKSYISVPAKEGKIILKAPFSIQTVKLRKLAKNAGSYKRSTHKVTAGKDEYQVKKGQDLYTIAKMHNTTWQILAQLNKATIKDPDKIVPGQFIKVPPKDSSLTGKTNERPDSLTSQTNYQVKKGETLSGISQRSGVSVEELQRMNGITNPTTLQAGQTIKLRGDVSVQTHTTPKPTPTARPTPKPASKPSASDEEEGFFGGLLESIEDGLEGINDAMSGGKNDKPAGGAPTAGTDSNSNASSTSGGYTVKSGDTLSSIAKKHGVNTNDLARTNGVKLTDTIHPGQKFKIPTNGANSSSTGSSSQSSRTDRPVNVTTKPSNSSDGTPKAVATTNGDCVCKALDLIWGKNFNCDERLKVIEICQNLWPNNYLKTANNLMAVFAWESGEKFETGTPNRQNSGGTGLIQIIPSTYKNLTGKEPIFETVYNYWGLGKNLRRVKQLADMTVLEYLDIVEKYFKPIKNKDLEFIDFYLQVLFPASSGLPEHVVFAKDYSDLDLPNEKEGRKKERVAKFSRNNMDKNNDDIVMKSEIAQSIKHYLVDGEDYKSFGNCEKFSVIEKPVSTTLCVNNIENCMCQTLNVKSNGIVLNSEVKQEPNKTMKNRINDVKAIIIHRTAGASALSSISWGRKKGNGAHFYVDNKNGVDGQIYQTVSLNIKAHHMGVGQFPKTKQAGIGNPTTISIEVAGLAYDKNGKQTWVETDHWEDVTDKQARSAACLLVALMKKYNFTYDEVHFHEDLCQKQSYEGRLVWIAMKKYLPNPPSGNKIAPYRNSPLIPDKRFPEE